MGDHHQVREITVLQNFLHNAFLIQFGLAFRYGTRWPEVLNGRRATKRKHTGVDATAIRTCQNLPDDNAVSSEGFSDTLRLLYTAGERFTSSAQFPGARCPIPSRMSTCVWRNKIILPPCFNAAQTCSSSARAGPAESVSKTNRQRSKGAVRLVEWVSMVIEGYCSRSYTIVSAFGT